MAETKKSTKSGFSAEERAAMKAAAAERKASQKQQDLDKALAEAIAKLPDDERKMAEKIDAIVREHAPMLASKTYYGMPGWARDGKVCVFMQPASKFKVRYCTIGFDPISNLDDGDMWPTSFAILEDRPRRGEEDHRPREAGRLLSARPPPPRSAVRRPGRSRRRTWRAESTGIAAGAPFRLSEIRSSTRRASTCNARSHGCCCG